MKRRDFLKMSSMATLATSLNGLPVHAFGENNLSGGLAKSRNSNGNILVIIQMQGGNDGLNTIIPLDKYSELSNARSNILINQNSVLNLTGFANTGMHPSMTGLQNLFNNGKMNIIQGVSYPNPSYSHFRSTDILFSGSDSDTYLKTGWIGRFLDNQFPGAPAAYPNPNFTDPLAIQIGSTVASILTGANGLNGQALSGINSFYNIVNGAVDPAPNTPAGHELTYVRFIAQQTQAYTQVIQQAALAGANLAVYPNNNLADQLKIVARLIDGGLQTPVYIVNIGGYDTHDNQVVAADHSTGQHANLLKRLSDSIAAFQQDLELMGKDDIVTGCTLTEFGRRIKSNASVGTDHGAGSPMIVFGAKVNPTIIGSNPVLPANADVNDNVPMQYDYRDIYSTILTDWFGVDATNTKDILDGGTFNHLPIFKWALGTETVSPINTQLSLEQNYPNPFNEHTTIKFTSEGGATQILLYDEMGRMVRVLYENDVPAGSININVDRNNLAQGNYYYQLHIGNQKLVKKMVVID